MQFRELVPAFMLFVALLMLVGCSRTAKMNPTGIEVTNYASRLPISLTLIGDLKGVNNPEFDSGGIHTYFDVKESVMMGVLRLLENRFTKVNVASIPATESDIYATINYSAVPSLVDGVILTGFETKLSVQFHNNRDSLGTVLSMSTLSQSTNKPAGPMLMATYGDESLLSGLNKALLEISEQLSASELTLAQLKDGQLNVASVKSSHKNTESKNKIYRDSIAAEAFNPYSRLVNEEVFEESEKDTEECVERIPWEIGKAVMRVSCINDALKNYTDSAAPMVDNFKAKRLKLAKDVDMGKLPTEEFAKLEQISLTILQSELEEFNDKHKLSTPAPSPGKIAHVAGQAIAGLIVGAAFVGVLAAPVLASGAIAPAVGSVRSGAPVYNVTTKAVCTAVSGGVAVCP
jgi:hypothetical protein